MSIANPIKIFMKNKNLLKIDFEKTEDLQKLLI